MRVYDVVVGYSEVCVPTSARTWREAEDKVRRALGMEVEGTVTTAVIRGREPFVYGVHTDDRDPHEFQPGPTEYLGPYRTPTVMCAECSWPEGECRKRFGPQS